MRPGDPQPSLQQQRRALSRSLQKLRKEARAELRRDPVLRRARSRRAIRRTLVGGALLALALLFHCQCDAPPPAVSRAAAPQATVPAKSPSPTTPKLPPLHARVERQSRAHFTNGAPTSPGWLDAFQLQVSARSPRLAACFTGADRPGALRWTASLDPKSGTVSDHAFEPVGATAELSPKQRACAVQVLSAPAYRLRSPAADELPARIALVIAF